MTPPSPRPLSLSTEVYCGFGVKKVYTKTATKTTQPTLLFVVRFYRKLSQGKKESGDLVTFYGVPQRSAHSRVWTTTTIR